MVFIGKGDATLVVLIYKIKLAELDKGRAELLLDEAVALLQWLEIMGDEATADAEADIDLDATSLD